MARLKDKTFLKGLFALDYFPSENWDYLMKWCHVWQTHGSRQIKYCEKIGIQNQVQTQAPPLAICVSSDEEEENPETKDQIGETLPYSSFRYAWRT